MLNKRLILLREEKKLTKKAVAEFLKIDQSTYGKYELAKREPDYEILLKLATFFNVSIDYLLGRIDVRNLQEPKIEIKPSGNLDVSILPEEDIRKVEEYVEMLKQKYNSDGSLKKK